MNGIDEIGLALCVYGEQLDPETISLLLGIAPTHSHRRGDLNKIGRAFEQGAWIFEVRTMSQPIDINFLFAHLFSALPEEQTIWKSLAREFELRIHFAVHTDAGCNFIASAETMALIAARQISVKFDIYMYGVEEISYIA